MESNSSRNYRAEKKVVQLNSSEVVIPFRNSQYYNRTLEECPTHYLDWLLGQDWVSSHLKEQIEEHLDTRPEWKRMNYDVD